MGYCCESRLQGNCTTVERLTMKFTSRADDMEDKLDKEIKELHKKIDRANLWLKIEMGILLYVVMILVIIAMTTP